jgi:hypothetical protein
MKINVVCPARSNGLHKSFFGREPSCKALVRIGAPTASGDLIRRKDLLEEVLYAFDLSPQLVD